MDEQPIDQFCGCRLYVSVYMLVEIITAKNVAE